MVYDAPYLIKRVRWPPIFFYVFNLILSFSTCSESFEKSVRGNFWARTSLSSLMAHIPWWLNFIAVGISLPFFCVISFDFNWSRSPKIQHPFALVCRCGLADIRRFVCADFRTDWDGSLEKWWWDAGTFSACKNFFFTSTIPLQEFSPGKVPCTKYLFIYLFIFRGGN